VSAGAATDRTANAVQAALDRGWPALSLAALALGLAASNWLTFPRAAGAAGAFLGATALLGLPPPARLALAAGALAALGLWWGALRLHELDRSVLAGRIGEPASARVVVTGATSVTPFAIRAMAEVQRFDGVSIRERVLLELPVGRAPPQGGIIELRARPVAPRGPEPGFDERGWLERRGVHVVLHSSGHWKLVGRRGGIGGVGDRLRTAVENALSLGTTGERRSLVLGIVLGADQGIDPELRDAFKASGLYHLLAVSGQNIVLIGFGVLGLAYVVGLSRVAGHLLAIVAILAYALAVGWQPSVVRAAVAGCLASVAWLLSRPSDRWHTMAAGAVVLLGGPRARPSSRASSSRSLPLRRSFSRCRACAGSPRATRCPCGSSRSSASRPRAASRRRRSCGSSSGRSRSGRCRRTPWQSRRCRCFSVAVSARPRLHR